MYVSWNNHTEQMSASVVKEVTCEKCRTQYLYALARTETGMGTSLYGMDEQGAQGRAADRAATRLENSLNDAFELVPCPNCGVYQPPMIVFLKNAHLKWLLLVAMLIMVGSVIALVVGFIDGNGTMAVTAPLFFLLGIGLIFFRRWSAERYDPNQGVPEPRKQLGRELAMLKADLSALMEAEKPKAPAPQGNVGRRRRTGRFN